MLKKFYLIVVLGIVLFYGASTAMGWEYFHPSRDKTTEENKKSGYRSRGPGVFIFYGAPRFGK